MVAQPFFGRGGLAFRLQFGLRGEEVVMDAKLGEILSNHVHHRADRLGAEQAQPRAFGRADEAFAIFGRELAGDQLQIIAGMKPLRSEEHTSELQSLMRISYAVFCLKKKKTTYRQQ